ncbi:MAG TPA: response regulator [Thalassobaculum sp.]
MSVASASAEGPSVLVVEDEALVAFMIEDLLGELGCRVSHLATRLQEGLSMAHHAEVDFALLDVNLAGEKSFPIADVLTGRGIPFAFVTGYGRRGVESRYATVPVVQKPFQRTEIDQVLSRWR